MINKFSVTVIFLFSFFSLYSQCSLTTIASDQNIVCGECVTLSAFGSGNGNVAFQENFNSGAPVGWQFTQSVTIANNTCGVPSPDGSPFMWMGDNSVNPRDMTTVSFDLTQGATICFEMRYAIQGDAAPCEGPDEPDEGVYLQYSTNGGATWVTIEYYDPNGGNDPQFTNWNQYCAVLPVGALTNNTMIRWHQDDVSGAEYDHWGIDNVSITVNDPTYQITWLHDNFSYPVGNGGGANPTPVCPQNTTTYNAQITNGTNTCFSSVTVTVVDPTLVFNLGNDTTLCPGDCVTLDAEAYELVSPASTPTFENNEIAPVFGGDAEMNINVQGLNANIITPTSITSVCLNGFQFSGSQFCGNFSGCNCNGTPINFGDNCDIDIRDFAVNLTCPSGTTITLVPSGEATGTSYDNVCFVPSGGQSITIPTFPDPGNFQPFQSLSLLNGCNSEGVWTMTLDGPGGASFGAGFLEGWSISFDDPELRDPVNFTWSPITNMTNSTTLTPTICPTATTNYTLTATDLSGCVTATDNITISVGVCCALSISDTTLVTPSCNASNGSITVDVTGQITGLEFSIDGGITFQSSNVFAGLAAGTYTIYATDDNLCSDSIVVTLVNSNSPVIDLITIIDANCGSSDGQIDISASGGVAPLQFSIDNGITFQTSQQFIGIPFGSYDVIVQDANGCQVSSTATVNTLNGPVIDLITITDASCGSSDGQIDVTASGGVAPLEYSIDNGVTFQTGTSFVGLSVGNYPIVVSDANGCLVTGSAQINNANGPVIDTIILTNESCGQGDGVIDVTISGGTAPFGFTIDNGVTVQTNGLFTNISAGTYNVVVGDINGCIVQQSVAIVNSPPPTITNTSVVEPSCGNADGSITITASGSANPLQYSNDNGATFQTGSTFSGLASGNYDIVVRDANGCEVVTSVNLTNPNTPIVNAGNDQTICSGDQTSLNGSGAPNLTWNMNVVDGVLFTPTSTQTYTLTGTDIAGCSSTDQVTITVISPPTPNIVPSQTSGCVPLTVSFSNQTVGSVNCVWNFSNGFSATNCTNQTVTFNSIGCFDLTFVATDANGCASIQNFTSIVCTSSSPVADFSPTPSSLTSEDPTSTMVNNSQGGFSYSWDFGDGSSSGLENPTHSFPNSETGSYLVTLIVTNEAGCTDTTVRTISVEEDLLFFVPNSFSPDGNEYNQTFKPVFTSGFDPFDFNMSIFNRWGETVFETNNDVIGWDGTYHEKLVSEGVYTWKIEFKTSKNDARQIAVGHVLILK